MHIAGSTPDCCSLLLPGGSGRARAGPHGRGVALPAAGEARSGAWRPSVRWAPRDRPRSSDLHRIGTHGLCCPLPPRSAGSAPHRRAVPAHPGQQQQRQRRRALARRQRERARRHGQQPRRWCQRRRRAAVPARVPERRHGDARRAARAPAAGRRLPRVLLLPQEVRVAGGWVGVVGGRVCVLAGAAATSLPQLLSSPPTPCRPVDVGYVCSVCLSIFCGSLPECVICGTVFDRRGGEE